MRIAFVRGPFLNPWELQTYLPLAERQTVIAIGADWQFYRQQFNAGRTTIRQVPVWGSSLAKIHPSFFVAYNKGLSWTTGQSFGLRRLDSAVGEVDLIHTAETFSTLTHQCLELSRKRSAKVVATVWENLPHMGELHPLRKMRKLRALRDLAGYIAPTDTTRRARLADGAPPERIAVIPMGVDTY